MSQTLDSAPTSGKDNNTKQFEQAFDNTVPIGAAEYDVVRSYFISVSDSDTIANNFTVFLFRIADITGYHVLSLLDDIKGKSGLEMNAIMAYYLNSIKSKATLYGVSASPQPNQAIQRNIVI
jgi:hypothetical protein